MADSDPLVTQSDRSPDIGKELEGTGLDDPREIGRGGFGVVYRCRQPALNRDVAVKVLTAMELEPANVDRFLREQQAMGALSGHPNIVHILQVGTTGSGSPYLVMPYHSHGSLENLIRREGRLQLHEAIGIAIKLAGALATAHRIGILHRDIKPGNVLLTDYGEPQLTDFGIARIEGGFETTAGVVTGSPAFTAPEVLGSSRPSVASDVYGLGSTLFCMITGHAAFERRSGEQVVAQFLRIAAQPLPDLRPEGIPDDLCAAIEASMSHNPGDRPRSATEFGELLRDIQRAHDQPVQEMTLPSTIADTDLTHPQENTGAPRPVLTGRPVPFRRATTPPTPETQFGPAMSARSLVGRSRLTEPLSSKPSAPPANDRGDVMTDAPALPTAPGLPVDMTSLIGRGAESTEVRRLLASSRLVTLTGIGGVGKTRLALHVARKARRSFSDGAILVELAEVADPALVALTVAQVVGAPTHQPDVVAALIDYLRGRELLLVLDNCEHLLDESAVLVRNLLSACADLRILVTSREPLRVGGEHVFEVEPLSVSNLRSHSAHLGDSRPDAVTLFAERASAAAPGFRITPDNAETVEELCRRLDGLPLAIELAAGRMRALSPRELLNRLDDHYRLLSVGDRSAAPRHQSLWATLDWSYELCSDRERLLWERLAVFTGTVHLQAAECICSGEDLAREAVVDCISALVDKSILAQHSAGGRPTYRMLETVREYGLRKLSSHPDEAAIIGRYQTYYQRLSREFDEKWFGPDQEEMVDRMRGEHANLRAVLDSLLSDPDDDGGGRAALGMASSLFWYWLGCGQQREGRHWLDRALAHGGIPSSERAAALWSNGYLAVAEGKAVVALDLLRNSQALARELGDTVNLAHATHFRGVAEHNLGNTTLGMTLIEEGSAMEAAGGPSLLHILALEQLGWAYCRRQEPDRALEVLEQCRSALTARGERWLLSWIHTFLGLAHWMRSDFTQAGEQLREALAGKRPFHDALGIAVVMEVLAWVAAADGDPGRSARLMGAVRRVWEPLGDYPGGFELRAWSERTEGEIRTLLGDSVFDAAFAEGGRMGTEQAVGYALGEAPPVEERSSTDDALIATLTARETEVARMLAEGMTNRQIAQRLVVALRTVETHVEHIFTKLGVNSRTQVAVLFARQRH